MTTAHTITHCENHEPHEPHDGFQTAVNGQPGGLDMLPVHCPGAVSIPARELRKGDVISMGTIAEVDLRETYVAIDFLSLVAAHVTALPLDLPVTVLGRGPVEVDVVAELTALADTWETRARLLRKPDRGYEWVMGERRAQALEAETCAHQLRALIGRLA